MRFVGVIPARYQSSRFPGKALAEVARKPVIQWVYEQAKKAVSLQRVIVATDDHRIAAAVQAFGGQVEMTNPRHQSGTDRVAEVAGRLEAEVFVNIQGDEPLIAPETIEAVCAPFREEPDLEVVTAQVPINDPEEAASPNVVKVVSDSRGRALYFSRAAIPYAGQGEPVRFKHLGIYGYRRRFLKRLPELEPSCLESWERLEQLRFLENGVPLQVVTVSRDSQGIDTPEDLERVRPLLENKFGRVEPVRRDSRKVVDFGD